MKQNLIAQEENHPNHHNSGLNPTPDHLYPPIGEEKDKKDGQPPTATHNRVTTRIHFSYPQTISATHQNPQLSHHQDSQNIPAIHHNP